MGTPSPQERPAGQRAPARYGIVVGIDGSQDALGALRVAAAEAQRRDAPLTLVTAYTITPYAANVAAYTHLVDDRRLLEEQHERILTEAEAEVGDMVNVSGVVKYGDAAKVLLECSEDADLVVVGSRGRGGFTGRLLGSTSSGLPSHSKAPVLIVPRKYTRALAEGERQDDTAPVVVGADGSRHSLSAALEAASHAMRRGVGLRLVGAVPPLTVYEVGWTPPTEVLTGLADGLRDTVNEDAEWLQGLFPELSVETDVVLSSPVQVLIAETATAPLTVLGTRGLGGFKGLLLGSTTNGVLHHAEGPVLTVSGEEDPRVADHPRIRRESES
ncbi:universal stress protein [Sediminivirga luteola]|uniref:Universal stress protein UspA n=1 Tax=Sediminivirga luteola TaxID=1774748 RepID=A0A8J2XLF3_9MICO|nr:universal stress protein [Sediminivirga luteola]MCI2265091.1 universal stress protein [Sediminivirga luteola]GGA21682.1 universal stress protein UspA [Sediminivirga luteola]